MSEYLNLLDFINGSNKEKLVNYKNIMNKKIEKLRSNNNLQQEKLNELNRVQKETELLQDYIKYFFDNMMNLDNDTKFETVRDLIILCNKHRQKYLLTKTNNGRGWFSDKVSSHCYYIEDFGCDGWYTNEKRCTCTNYKGWCWELDCDDKKSLENILYFNIFSQKPLGYAKELW
jgi:hypothetical protein